MSGARLRRATRALVLDDDDRVLLVQLGPLVWTRTHHVPLSSGRWDGQTERYYLVRTPSFEPAPRLTWEELRSEGMTDARWWTPEELEASKSLFAPRRLPLLLRSLRLEGPPAEPLDAGV